MHVGPRPSTTSTRDPPRVSYKPTRQPHSRSRPQTIRRSPGVQPRIVNALRLGDEARMQVPTTISRRCFRLRAQSRVQTPQTGSRLPTLSSRTRPSRSRILDRPLEQVVRPASRFVAARLDLSQMRAPRCRDHPFHAIVIVACLRHQTFFSLAASQACLEDLDLSGCKLDRALMRQLAHLLLGGRASERSDHWRPWPRGRCSVSTTSVRTQSDDVK